MKKRFFEVFKADGFTHAETQEAWENFKRDLSYAICYGIYRKISWLFKPVFQRDNRGEIPDYYYQHYQRIIRIIGKQCEYCVNNANYFFLFQPCIEGYIQTHK